MILALFFFSAAPPTAIYTLSLHDALPILRRGLARRGAEVDREERGREVERLQPARVALRREVMPLRIVGDRKSTRLNSSHVSISYAVFCLKKKREKLLHTASLGIVFRLLA